MRSLCRLTDTLSLFLFSLVARLFSSPRFSTILLNIHPSRQPNATDWSMPPYQSSSLRVCTRYRSKLRCLQRSRRWGQTQPLLHSRSTFDKPLYIDLYTFTNARAMLICFQSGMPFFDEDTEGTTKSRNKAKNFGDDHFAGQHSSTRTKPAYIHALTTTFRVTSAGHCSQPSTLNTPKSLTRQGLSC